MPLNCAQQIYALYGNPAYPQSPWIYGGFQNAAPGSDRAAFNHMMSKVRESVEWGFKEVVKFWKFLDFRASMKVFETPVARYYVCAVFLTNLHNCIYGSQTSEYFNCMPPSLTEYVALVSHMHPH